MLSVRQLTNQPFPRFLIGGAVNTVVTYAVFLGLSLVVHYSIAYTVTYLVGMIVSYWLAGAFVFDTGFNLGSALRFPLAYVVSYLYGLGALFLLIDILGVPHYAAILVVIATGIPLNFMLQRYAMTAGGSPPG
jgi:putative flippase GtrA